MVTNMRTPDANFNEKNRTEEGLCRRAQNGDRAAEEALAAACSDLVKSCARPYFLAGAESEDLIQEGMLGLLKAIRSYDAAKGVPFRAYARICVTRRIYSAVRTAGADKHQPLNRSESILEQPLLQESPDLSLPRSSDPELLVIGIEERRESMQRLSEQLSKFEKQVLDLFLQGLSYQAMAGQLGKPVKSIDNAVQRIRRKAASIFHGEYRA